MNFSGFRTGHTFPIRSQCFAQYWGHKFEIRERFKIRKNGF